MFRTRLRTYQFLLKEEKRFPGRKEYTFLKMGGRSHDVRGASYNQNILRVAELEKEAQHTPSNPICLLLYGLC